MNRKFLILISAVAIVVLVGVGYYFFINDKKSEYFLAVEKGNNFVEAGDYGPAFESFNKSLELAYNQDAEMLSRLKIGAVYTALDPEKGVPYLKSLSLDESSPSRIRAGAINLVLTIYIGNREKDFAKRVIFVGDKWQDFLINDDFSLAVKNASEWSSSLHSTSLAEYRIAMWLVNQIRDDKIPNNEKPAYLSMAKDRFGKGSNDLATSSQENNPETVGWGYIYKGNISEFLLDYSKESGIIPQDIIEIYNRAIEILEGDSNNIQLSTKAAYARFYLAAFMARSNNQESRIIKEILGPIYDNKNKNYFDKFINSVKNPSSKTTQAVHDDATRLSDIDPLFKDYLTAIGWGDGEKNPEL